MCQAHIKLWFWFGLIWPGLGWPWFGLVLFGMSSSITTNPGWVGGWGWGWGKSKLKLNPAWAELGNNTNLFNGSIVKISQHLYVILVLLK